MRRCPECGCWEYGGALDAAFERLTCAACGNKRGRGPTGCGPCDLDEGFRYSARETDRPGVKPGNEHAIRVGVSVLRNAHRHSPRALLSWRLGVPAVLAGYLPTMAEAQGMRARINRGAGYDELAALMREGTREWALSPDA